MVRSASGTESPTEPDALVKRRERDAPNFATSLATAAVWDGARAVAGDERSYAAAVAATLAGPAADLAANLCIQVHGGIGYTWEHDAHLYYRRAKSDELLLGGPYRARAELAALLEI